MEKITQFLKLNGKLIWFTTKNGITYIAIKPICEAFEIDFHRQWVRIKEHPILSGECSNMTIHVPNDRGRKFFCLPEEFIYGWIFSIDRDNSILIEYQRKCYKLLFEHFHGSLTERKALLLQKAEMMAERHQLESNLRLIDDYKRVCDIKGSEMRIAKELNKMDKEIITATQLNLDM